MISLTKMVVTGSSASELPFAEGEHLATSNLNEKSLTMPTWIYVPPCLTMKTPCGDMAVISRRTGTVEHRSSVGPTNRLDARRCTACVDNQVNRIDTTLRDVELCRDLRRSALRVRDLALALVRLARQVDVGRCVALREIKTRLDNVDRNDALGAESLSNGHCEETNGAGAEDDDGLVGLEVAEVCHGVYTDGQRLHHRTILERKVLGKRVGEVCREFVVAAKGTVVRWCGSEDHLRAELVVAALARVTDAARRTRLECNTGTNSEVLYVGAD